MNPSISNRARRGRVLAWLGVAFAVIVTGGWVPGPVGAAISSALPWLAVPGAVLLLCTALLARRAVPVAVASLMVWIVAMAPVLPGDGVGSSGRSFTVASQNVKAQSGDAGQSARDLADSGADVIALIELDADGIVTARDSLALDYPYTYAVGTIAVWSKSPFTDAVPLFLGLGWNRALRVHVSAPGGDIAIYLIHAASLRIGQQNERDTMLTSLATEVAEDDAARILAVGDFNAAGTDPALNALNSRLEWVRPTDGTLGFTWPARFPLARIDHAFSRGLEVISSTTAAAGTSDQRAVLTSVRL